MQKSSSTPSGAVFYYDIHPEEVKEIQKAISKNRSIKPLVVTSELGYPILKAGIDKILSREIDMVKVKNRWFGGTIMCTGLMTVEDIISGVKEHIVGENPDLIIVPSTPFDVNGRDMAGRSLYDIEDAVNIKTIVIY
jgi:NifB/MoaA-like Fe-S oxidoreductase